MGCYDKTCCITNTAISSGEKCLLVILNPTKHYSLYDFNSNLYSQKKREKQVLEEYELDVIEENGYFIGDFLPIKDAIVGTYNDYGSIEESDLLPDDYEDLRMDYTHFYHVWAIEYLFEKSIDDLLKDKIGFMCELYSKLYYLRKSPFDLSLSGQQHKDIEEMEFMVGFNKRINEYLLKKIEEYNENQ